MRVGIITLHNSYSYGACLQAYATYLTLMKLGHNPVMIDYVNSYEQNQNRIISRKSDYSFAKNLVYTLENVFLFKRYNMNKAFEGFFELYEKTDRYTSLNRLRENIDKESLDCLISGSDQLWNPEIFCGLDTSFLLDFGSSSLKRIAYAASAGSHMFTNDEIDVLIPLLKRYDAVSVREKTLKNQIDKYLDQESTMVLDPTFLISGGDWLSAFEDSSNIIKEKFILLYMIGVPHKEYISKYAPIVNYISKYLGLPVLAINPLSFFTLEGASHNLTSVTPKELINLINEAEIVLTSSFHGVALSINLNKTFIAFKTSNPSRIENLLNVSNLQDRLIDCFEINRCVDLLKPINFSVTNGKISALKNYSIDWLSHALSD